MIDNKSKVKCFFGSSWLEVEVNTGSDNGLVPEGTKPLPEPQLTQIYLAVWHLQATMC